MNAAVNAHEVSAVDIASRVDAYEWSRISGQSDLSKGDRTFRVVKPRSSTWRKGRTIMKLDADEKEILDSMGRGEWRPARTPKRAQSRYTRYAKATFKKDRRLNIRISTKDLEAIQKRALEEGLPYQTLYQTLIASLLHKYASGRLRET